MDISSEKQAKLHKRQNLDKSTIEKIKRETESLLIVT